MSASTSAPLHQQKAAAWSTKYFELETFKDMGEPDVVLRLEGGGELPVHSELLNVYSKVLREVTRGTLKRKLNQIDVGSFDVTAPSVIPLGDGSISDLQSWIHSLTALYGLADGANDDDTWRKILGQDDHRAKRSVVSFTSGSLAELVQLVNDTRVPTSFDLGGRELRLVGSESVSISAKDVSIRNGSIWLAGTATDAGLPSLCFTGTGVELDEMMIHGGRIGVYVLQGASVTLRACTVQGSTVGVYTETSLAPGSMQPSLMVHGLKILNCKGQSMYIGANTRMQVTDCLINGNTGIHSIVVQGSLRATRLICSENIGIGMHIGNAGDAIVTDSTITGNTGCSVDGLAGGKVMLGRCTSDGMTATTPMDCISTSNLQQVISKEQSLASVGMYLLADKYNIPSLAKFAGRSLQRSLNLSTADSWNGNAAEALDPWQIAAYASQCNDSELITMCMELVAAPLKKGKSLLVPTTPDTLPPLIVALLEQVNLLAKSHSFVKRT